MLAIIVFTFGSICGGMMLLALGVPVVLLNLFRLLPLDRRLWWTAAAVLAYLAIHDSIHKSYDYAPPTGAPEKFYFQAHLFGGSAGVVGCFLLGMALLSLWIHPFNRSVNPWIVTPMAATLLGLGITSAANWARPLSEKRTEQQQARASLVDALKAGNAVWVSDCLQSGTTLKGRVDELGRMTMIEHAISNHNVDVVKVLLAPPRGRAVDLNARQFVVVLKSQDQSLVDAFLEGKQGSKYIERMLRASIALGSKEYFDVAIRRNVDPDACEAFDTPLTLCAKHDRQQFARRLISLGADVNGVHRRPDLNRGSTPLVTAADHGHDEMVVLLLSEGASVNKTTEGMRSALQAACRSGKPEIVKQLLKHGANVNYRTSTGATALHWAVNKSHWNEHVDETTRAEIIELLLSAGADETLKDRHGTVLEIAERQGFQSVVERLKG